MRKPLFVGNWKMHKNPREAKNFVLGLKSQIGEMRTEVVVCPPYIALQEVASLLDHRYFCLGAQNLYFEEEGAFTGEISASMLSSVSVSYVIVGHSERRQLFEEKSSMLIKKVSACFSNQLIPIFCVGESESIREAGDHIEYVKEQMAALLKDQKSYITATNFVVAYEPIWAIGTGKTATAADANAMHASIRDVIGSYCGVDLARKIRILYGGSVKPNNAQELMRESHIDGVLVGGASLDVSTFAQVVKEGLCVI